jgi:hypothetical protein
MASETLVTPATPREPQRGAQQDLRKHINGVRERLSQEFEPRVDPAVVSREVDIAAAQYDGARITAFVPVLVNRQVRLKLRELVSAA